MKSAYLFVLALLVAASASAAPINAALGKPVTISGAVGVITCCWPDATVYPPAAPSTIVDGIFRPESTEWQDGSVWWDEVNPGSFNNIIEIDLMGLFQIDHLTIQADNNDFYGIDYRNELGAWLPAFVFAPVFPGFGMTTRDAAGLTPFRATGFRIDASGGDAFYSVSEFQAIGDPVPEPASLFLLGTGLVGAGARRWRNRRAA